MLKNREGHHSDDAVKKRGMNCDVKKLRCVSGQSTQGRRVCEKQEARLMPNRCQQGGPKVPMWVSVAELRVPRAEFGGTLVKFVVFAVFVSLKPKPCKNKCTDASDFLPVSSKPPLFGLQVPPLWRDSLVVRI